VKEKLFFGRHRPPGLEARLVLEAKEQFSFRTWPIFGASRPMESWLDERQACDSKMKVESHGLSYQLSIKDWQCLTKTHAFSYLICSGLGAKKGNKSKKRRVFVKMVVL